MSHYHPTHKVNANYIPLSSKPVTPTNQYNKGKGAKGVGGLADKYCVYVLEDEKENSSFSIEYKPPFRFPAADILQGLQRGIFPNQELMNKDGKGSEYFTWRLVSVVITQLFSYRVKTGVQHGYISTGDMMIFLHISDDPEQVGYHIWNPRDFDFDDTDSLHNTAIAKIVAFSVQALAAKPPPQDWHDLADKLGIYYQRIRFIPLTRLST